MTIETRDLRHIDTLLGFARSQLAKAETAPSREDRDALQARHLQEFVDVMRDYFEGFAERVGVPFDPDDIDLSDEKPLRIVNPTRDQRHFKVTKAAGFVGFPTRPPFNLKVDWDKEADILADAMTGQYTKWLKRGTARAAADLAAVNADIGAVRGIAGALDLGDYDPSIRASLSNLITRVTEVQKTLSRDIVQQGIERGLSTKQIANGIPRKPPDPGFRGIKGLIEQSYKNRSRVIALTESANAYNLGQLEGYKRSGIVDEVRIFDGADCGWTSHNDADKANGTTRTIAQAQAHPTSHPNCQRAWSPVPVGQTKGSGSTRSQPTGTPKTPPSATPKAPSPSVPTPSSAASTPAKTIGRPGTTYAEASFDDVVNHILPDGYTWDDAAGVIRKPDGFADIVPVDGPMKKRLAQIMSERYNVTFSGTPKSAQIYDAHHMRDMVKAFESYRNEGIGFDDLLVKLTARKTGKAAAHFDVTSGAAGEVQFHATLPRALARAKPSVQGDFLSTEGSFQNVATHELGHALDARVMGHAGGGARGPIARLSTTSDDMFKRWSDLHEQGVRVGSSKQVDAQLIRQRELVKLLDEQIQATEGRIRTGAKVPSRETAQHQTNLALRKRYAQKLDELEAAKGGRVSEPLPSRYAAETPAEDFAESIEAFFDNPAKFRKAFPQRAKFIDEALDSGRALPKNFADDVGQSELVKRIQAQVAARKEQLKARAARRKAWNAEQATRQQEATKRAAAARAEQQAADDAIRARQAAEAAKRKAAAEAEARRKAAAEAAKRKAAEEAAKAKAAEEAKRAKALAEFRAKEAAKAAEKAKFDRLAAERLAERQAADRAKAAALKAERDAAKARAARGDAYVENKGLADDVDWERLHDRANATGSARRDGGDNIMRQMNKELGTDGLPLVRDSVDDLVEQGWQELWRGVDGTTHAQAYRTGDFFPGYGIFGNGTYTATGTFQTGGQLASGYARGTNGILRMVINPKAKLIENWKAIRQMEDAKKAFTARHKITLDPDGRGYFYGARAKGVQVADDAGNLTPVDTLYPGGRVSEAHLAELANHDDIGQWALSKGYDGITVSKGEAGLVVPGSATSKEAGYIVVLNRTATVVENVNHINPFPR